LQIHCLGQGVSAGGELRACQQYQREQEM
jgi:hypothetical protein